MPAAREAHTLRRAIEIEIARQLAQAPDPAVVAELRVQLARQAERAAQKNYLGFIAADKEFHRLMYIAAGRPRL